MFPKDDPYATKSARAFDCFLILFAIVVVIVALLTSPNHRGEKNARPHSSPVAATGDRR
jgi:hypothetical protein